MTVKSVARWLTKRTFPIETRDIFLNHWHSMSAQRQRKRDQMPERKLPIRTKKASKGVASRISDQVYNILGKQRRGQSWDALFRQIHGLEDRNGNKQALVEGILETVTGRFLLRDPDKPWDDLEKDAYEIGIVKAAKLGIKRV